MSFAWNDSDFARGVSVPPFDHETDLERERRLEHEASYCFRMREQRDTCIRAGRATIGCIAFTLIFGVLLYAAWSLPIMRILSSAWRHGYGQ